MTPAHCVPSGHSWPSSGLQPGRRGDPAIAPEGLPKESSRSPRPRAERPRPSGSSPFHLLPSPRAPHAHCTGFQHLSGPERAEVTLCTPQARRRASTSAGAGGGGLDTWSRDPEQATHRLTRTGLARRRSPEKGGPGGEEKVLRVLLEAAVAAAHAAGPDARRGPPRGAGGQAGVRRPPAPRGSRRAAPSRRPAVLLQLRPPLKTPSEPLPRAPPPSPRASRLG